MDPGIHTCPHCKTTLVLETRPHYYYTCDSCREVFIKYEPSDIVEEEIVAKSETMSPILIGSKGKINDETYEVTGCVTLFQNRTTVNIYSAMWKNGLYNYIVECDGDYHFIDYVNEHPGSKLKETKVGKEIDISGFGNAFCFSLDKTICISIKGQGKLMFPKFSGSIFCSFYAKNKKVAFCFFSKEHTSLLTGTLYSFGDLNLSPIRIINDWYK